jgi:hypothetical protein
VVIGAADHGRLVIGDCFDAHGPEPRHVLVTTSRATTGCNRVRFLMFAGRDRASSKGVSRGSL